MLPPSGGGSSPTPPPPAALAPSVDLLPPLLLLLLFLLGAPCIGLGNWQLSLASGISSKKWAMALARTNLLRQRLLLPNQDSEPEPKHTPQNFNNTTYLFSNHNTTTTPPIRSLANSSRFKPPNFDNNTSLTHQSKPHIRTFNISCREEASYKSLHAASRAAHAAQHDHSTIRRNQPTQHG